MSRKAIALMALLAACGPEAGLTPAGPTPPDDCGASALVDQVGTPAAALDEKAFDRPVRIIWPGTAITEDYSPARLNFDIGADGLVARIWCG